MVNKQKIHLYIMLEEDISYYFLKESKCQNTFNPRIYNCKSSKDFDISIPEEIEILLSDQYLTNPKKYEICIDAILEYFIEDRQFPLPLKFIKNVIEILDNSNLDRKFIEKTLFVLDISLDSFTSNLKLSSTEINVIYKYFPNQYAINILSHAIRLSSKCAKPILELFPPKKNFKGFNSSVITLISHNFTQNLLPILNLVYVLSDKFEIAYNFTKIYQTLIPIIYRLPPPEQVISFKILINMCKQDQTKISILYNSDGVEKLYSNIKGDNELLEIAFQFLHFISKENEKSLVIIKRLRIHSAVKYAIENLKENAIKIISATFYNILQDNDGAVDYFLKKKYFYIFLSLQKKVSLSTWEEVMTTLCIVIYYCNSMQQIEYILQNSNIIQCISETSESVDFNDDDNNKTQLYIASSIKFALQKLLYFAKFEFERNNRKIFNQDIRNQLMQSAVTESSYDIHPITDFIQSIDCLYNSC